MLSADLRYEAPPAPQISFDQFLAVDPAGYVIRLGEFGLTMGQTLSLPMLAVGLGLILWSRRRA